VKQQQDRMAACKADPVSLLTPRQPLLTIPLPAHLKGKGKGSKGVRCIELHEAVFENSGEEALAVTNVSHRFFGKKKNTRNGLLVGTAAVTDVLWALNVPGGSNLQKTVAFTVPGLRRMLLSRAGNATKRTNEDIIVDAATIHEECFGADGRSGPLSRFL
jgi:hypothetical protein